MALARPTATTHALYQHPDKENNWGQATLVIGKPAQRHQNSNRTRQNTGNMDAATQRQVLGVQFSVDDGWTHAGACVEGVSGVGNFVKTEALWHNCNVHGPAACLRNTRADVEPLGTNDGG